VNGPKNLILDAHAEKLAEVEWIANGVLGRCNGGKAARIAVFLNYEWTQIVEVRRRKDVTGSGRAGLNMMGMEETAADRLPSLRDEGRFGALTGGVAPLNHRLLRWNAFGIGAFRPKDSSKEDRARTEFTLNKRRTQSSRDGLPPIRV
jgi:hypothetical protein